MSNDAYVYASPEPLTPDQVCELAASLFGTNAPIAIVRRVNDAQVLRFTGDLPLQWPEGQAFGPPGELRWRPAPGGRRAILLLTEAASPKSADLAPLPGPSLVADPVSTGKNSALLWGTHMRPDPDAAAEQVWWETRIPRPLRYPGSHGPRPPRLALRLYRERESGAVRWTRLVGLVEDD